jgi:hypothetical protein
MSSSPSRRFALARVEGRLGCTPGWFMGGAGRPAALDHEQPGSGEGADRARVAAATGERGDGSVVPWGTGSQPVVATDMEMVRQ